MTPTELRAIRERLRRPDGQPWSQYDMAKALRTTQATISRWEAGERSIHPLAAEKARELDPQHCTGAS